MVAQIKLLGTVDTLPSCHRAIAPLSSCTVDDHWHFRTKRLQYHTRKPPNFPLQYRFSCDVLYLINYISAASIVI